MVDYKFSLLTPFIKTGFHFLCRSTWTFVNLVLVHPRPFLWKGRVGRCGYRVNRSLVWFCILQASTSWIAECWSASVLRRVSTGNLQLEEEDKARGTRRTNQQSWARCLSTRMYSQISKSMILRLPPEALKVSLLYYTINMLMLLTGPRTCMSF